MTRFALKHKQVALREEDDIKFIPYTRHVNDTVVALADGSLMRMYRVDGRPFETCDITDLNTWHNKLNIAWRTIGDDRVAVWTHLVRTATNPELDGEFQSAFARDLQARYSERLKEKVLYHNEFYVTIVVRPSNMAGDQLTRLFGKTDASYAADDRAMAIMADKCRDFESMLADTNPVPLSLYERDGVLFSQPMEVLHFIQTGDRIRIPLVHGRLGQAIYNSRIIFGREAAEIRLPDRSHYLGMFGVREYVANTRSGQFNSLLTLDFPYVLTQSFAPLVKSVAAERFQKKYKQMVSSDDAGVSQAEELLDGVDDLMSNRFVMGEHHLSIAVIDDDRKRLLERLSIARAAAADTGMVMAREDVALEAAFWAQLPGNFKMRARPAVINSRNFAAMSPFHTFPAGRKSGNHWGEAVTLLKTRAGSSFWFNFHRADIGHTLIIGPTGGGKTVLQNFLLAQLEKTGAKQIFFDKDRGAEIFVRACGGTYLALRNGEPTGFAPLKGLEPTHDNMAFLRQFIASGFSYVAGYGIRLLPVIQNFSQLDHIYGDKVAKEISANCGVQIVMRPKEINDAKNVSERLGTYTFRAKSRSFGAWGRGGGSVSESDQRRALLLPQELLLLPEKDLIVLRSGIPPVYGKKIRYYQEKDMLAQTKVQAPAMPTIRPDPSVPARSLRVITAAEASGESEAGIPGSSGRPLNMPVVKALQTAANHAPRQTAHMLFKDLISVMIPTA